MVVGPNRAWQVSIQKEEMRMQTGMKKDHVRTEVTAIVSKPRRETSSSHSRVPDRDPSYYS